MIPELANDHNIWDRLMETLGEATPPRDATSSARESGVERNRAVPGKANGKQRPRARRRVPFSTRVGRSLAVAALATSPSITAAAQSSGLGESTLRRWLGNPKFAAAVERARREIFDGALLKARDLLTKALTTFDLLMDSPKESIKLGAAAAAVKAASLIQEQRERDRLLNDLSDRLDKLERHR